jgi:acyl-CoA thioesterase FadM
MTGSPRNPGPFRCEAAITFDQSDPAGILFFGNVFPLAHRAFERMLADAGIAWADWFASDTWTIPITRASADFSAPLPAGRTAELEVVVADLRTSAFALSVTVISPVRGFFTAFPCAEGQPDTSSVNARPGFPTPNLVVASPDSVGKVCLFSSKGGQVIVDVSGWWAPGLNRFTPIDPVRAYDTRKLAEPVMLPAGDIRAVVVGGEFVPDDAVAVTVNVAAINPDGNGFMTVFPCGVEPPLASNLNVKAGERRAVGAIVELGNTGEAAGKICVTGSATTHFIVDVTGYDAPSSPWSPDVVLEPLPDTRVLDTRDPSLPGTRFDGETFQRFDLTDSVPGPDETVAAVLNVVAVRADRASFVTVYPCQSPRPTTSSLNYDLDQTANLVVTALSDDGEVCIFTNSSVDIVVDLVGVYAGPADSLVNQLSLTDDTDGFLVPDQQFEVDGPEYTLRCDAETELGLQLGVAPRVTARLNDVVVERDPVDPNLTVTIAPDDPITVELQRGAVEDTYSFRCLPADFPPFTVTRTGENAPGWYLTEMGWDGSGSAVFIVILDERGVPVWYKRTDRRLIDLKALSNGNLVASPVNGFGFGIDGESGHRIMDLDGKLVAEHLTDSTDFPVDHHEYAEILGAPAGEGRAVISYSVKTDIDLSSLTLTSDDANAPCDPSVVATGQRIMDNTIREVDGDNTLLWEWSAFDNFLVEESTYALCFDNRLPDEPENEDDKAEADLFHINGLQRIDENGCGVAECDYLVTARHLDGAFRLDRVTGAVEWIVSSRVPDPDNPVPNDDLLLEIVDDPFDGPLRMHDARLVGDILTMHDNRTGTGGPSRVVTYRIDTTNGTATLVDQIDNPSGATSGAFGSARITPDGSMLVDWGRLQPMFIEYDSSGAELMRIEMAPGQAAYRIVKYAPDQFDAEVLRLAAGGSVEAPT